MPKSEKPKRLSLFTGITITGFVISAAVTIIIIVTPPFISQDKSIGIVIGLVGFILTLLIDFNEKLKDVAKTNEIAEQLRQEPELAPKLKKILDDCVKVKQSKVDIFIKRMNSSLDNCNGIIHDLSEGESKPDPLSPSFRLEGAFSKGRRTVYIVQGFDPASSIEGEFGKKYLKAQGEAHSNGVTLKVIWVQPNESLTKYKDGILSQAKAISGNEPIGDHVRILDPNENMNINPQYRDYGLVDEEILYFPQQDRGRDSKVEHISMKRLEVDNAIMQFNTFWSLATSVDEYYTHLVQPPAASPPASLQTPGNPPSTPQRTP